MELINLLLILMTITITKCWLSVSEGCNEAVCASIVSKCMLTQSCKCDDFKLNKTCRRDCFHCLDYLYQDCCSCVEMCPKQDTNDSSLASKSHVEELPEPQQDLFAVLTEEKDHLFRWTSYTNPIKVVVLEAIGSQVHKDMTFSSMVTKSDSDGVDQERDAEVNCTVAYMSQCMSWNKCKSSCTSMGASSYRWFHDGCCECVGSYCVNYGINESKCLQCPLTTDHDVDMSIVEHDSNARTEERITGTDYDFDENHGKARDDDEDSKSHNTLSSNEKFVETKDEKDNQQKKLAEEQTEPKKPNI